MTERKMRKRLVRSLTRTLEEIEREQSRRREAWATRNDREASAATVHIEHLYSRYRFQRVYAVGLGIEVANFDTQVERAMKEREPRLGRLGWVA